MTLSELQDEVRRDLRICPDDLTNESVVKTPDIHWKYNKMLMAERLALKKLEREWDVLYLQRWEYYKKKADPEVYESEPLLKRIGDSDVKFYLSADKQLQEQRFKIEAKEELIDFLKRTMENIAQRTWLIKNAMDHLKYHAGGPPPKDY